MLKQTAIILLLFAILGQTFHRAVIVTSYYANTGAYAKNCENKAKPALHCNGKCQMLKKMKQEENSDQQNAPRKGQADEVLSSKSFFSSIAPMPHRVLKHAGRYLTYFPSNIGPDHFHPPQC